MYRQVAADGNLGDGQIGEFRAIGPSSRRVGSPNLCARAFAEGRIPACLEVQPLLDAATRPPDAPSATEMAQSPVHHTRGSFADAGEALSACARCQSVEPSSRTIAMRTERVSSAFAGGSGATDLAVMSRNLIQLEREPTLFTSTRTGPLSLATTMSVSPSLSRSPNAAPRPTSSTVKAACPIRDLLEATLATVAKELTALLQTGTARSRRALRPYASLLRSRWRDPADHRCPHRATLRAEGGER